jgi:hypothetical protein
MSESLVNVILNDAASRKQAAAIRYPQLLDVKEATPELAAELEEVAELLGKSIDDIRRDARTRRSVGELLQRIQAAKGVNARGAAWMEKSKKHIAQREEFLAKWLDARRPIDVEEMELARLRGNAREAERELRTLKDANGVLLADLKVPHAVNVFEEAAD